MQPAPRVVAVILNDNLTNCTISCVRSLRKATYPSLDVLVLDSASPQRDMAGNAAVLLGIALRSIDRNNAYTGGINAGVRWAMESSQDYLRILNPYTEVKPGLLGHLVGATEACPTAAVACGTIYKSHVRVEVWYAGGREEAGIEFQ